MGEAHLDAPPGALDDDERPRLEPLERGRPSQRGQEIERQRSRHRQQLYRGELVRLEPAEPLGDDLAEPDACRERSAPAPDSLAQTAGHRSRGSRAAPRAHRADCRRSAARFVRPSHRRRSHRAPLSRARLVSRRESPSSSTRSARPSFQSAVSAPGRSAPDRSVTMATADPTHGEMMDEAGGGLVEVVPVVHCEHQALVCRAAARAHPRGRRRARRGPSFAAARRRCGKGANATALQAGAGADAQHAPALLAGRSSASETSRDFPTPGRPLTTTLAGGCRRRALRRNSSSSSRPISGQPKDPPGVDAVPDPWAPSRSPHRLAVAWSARRRRRGVGGPSCDVWPAARSAGTMSRMGPGCARAKGPGMKFSRYY